MVKNPFVSIGPPPDPPDPPDPTSLLPPDRERVGVEFLMISEIT